MQYLGHLILNNYAPFIWNSNLIGCPLFLLAKSGHHGKEGPLPHVPGQWGGEQSPGIGVRRRDASTGAGARAFAVRARHKFLSGCLQSVHSEAYGWGGGDPVICSPSKPNILWFLSPHSLIILTTTLNEASFPREQATIKTTATKDVSAKVLFFF